jgi:hypothetical protein
MDGRQTDARFDALAITKSDLYPTFEHAAESRLLSQPKVAVSPPGKLSISDTDLGAFFTPETPGRNTSATSRSVDVVSSSEGSPAGDSRRDW